MRRCIPTILPMEMEPEGWERSKPELIMGGCVRNNNKIVIRIVIAMPC